MAVKDTLTKARSLWGDMIALQNKIQLEEPQASLLNNAAVAQDRLESIIKDLIELESKQSRSSEVPQKLRA